MTTLDRIGDMLCAAGVALAEALNGTVTSAIVWRKGLTSPDDPTISRVAGALPAFALGHERAPVAGPLSPASLPV